MTRELPNLYLKAPPAWKLFGKLMFMVGIKP
jgi:hypothetical protein